LIRFLRVMCPTPATRQGAGHHDRKVPPQHAASNKQEKDLPEFQMHKATGDDNTIAPVALF
jgi:hypothetical protein